MYRYFRLLSEETICLNRIKILDSDKKDISLGTKVTVSSLENGFTLNGLVTNDIGTYQSLVGRGIDNRRENSLELNVVELDLGIPMPMKDIILEIPHDMRDSWKLAYCSWQLLDEHRRIICSSEVMFHHWGRREISVNYGHIMPFTIYPTRNMIEASRIKIKHIHIPVERYPKWNTFKQGGIISFQPKLYIDYPELIYMGRLFENVGYATDTTSSLI
jgi:hypothetical protein